ncbi:MAG: response regulator [Bdellovibrionales bacterium]|nr:response regulator [Bdellovibrionales bacterium]
MSVNLLIVDDEEEIREMLSRHFRFLGYDVEIAKNGIDALEKLSKRKTDIVISDISMPQMDGAELCREIRRDYPMTRVIMMTGYVTLENALACVRRGADTCVFKPLENLTELEDSVARSVDIIKNWIRILVNLQKMKPILPQGDEHEGR